MLSVKVGTISFLGVLKHEVLDLRLSEKKYAPAVIYCGGWSVAYEEFCIFWSGMKSDDLNMQIEQISEIGCHYTWLRNGEEKRPTLLMIGPFFGNRYGLNSYRKYFDVAKAIKALVEKKSWVQMHWN